MLGRGAVLLEHSLTSHTICRWCSHARSLIKIDQVQVIARSCRWYTTAGQGPVLAYGGRKSRLFDGAFAERLGMCTPLIDLHMGAGDVRPRGGGPQHIVGSSVFIESRR